MRRNALLIFAGCSFQGADLPVDGARDAVVDVRPVPDAFVDDNPPGGYFQPLVFWYAAEDAVHDSANHVTSWPDRGTGHLDLTGSATFQPATPARAAMLGLDHDYLSNPAGVSSPLGQATLIAVVAHADVSDTDWLLYTGGTSAAQALSIAVDHQLWTADFTNANEQTVFQTDPGPWLLTYVVDSTTTVLAGFHRVLYANGVAVQEGSSFTTFAPVAAPIEVGDHVAAPNPFAGGVGELYLAGTAAHADDRLALETYFGLRYGISLGHDYLDAMHRKVWTSGNGADHRIFGIAHDFKARLEILVAGSTDDVLRFEATTAPSDGSYMIAGDNGGDATFTGNAFGRVWRVENNWNAPVQLEFEITPPAGKTPILRFASDASFSAASTAPLMQQSNGRWTVTEGLPPLAYVTLVAP